MDLTRDAWRTSSYSGNNGGACVEITTMDKPAPTVAVRDSKNPNGPSLAFSPEAWTAFTRYAKRGGDH
jgi:hypothetical protein